MFVKEKREYVDLKTMNEHLLYVKKYRQRIYREKGVREPFGNKAFIVDKQVEFRLSYKKGSKACTYICYKDGRSGSQVTDGGEAFRILNRYYKVPRFENLDIGSAKPLLYKNDKYEEQRVDAIGYDLNSAYAYAMTQQMPDTSVKPYTGNVKPGYIGFRETENHGLIPVSEGFSLYVFPLMESPFKRFVDNWYKKKLNGDKKAKGVLTYSVGYLQKVNPYLRATIIGYCNNYIKSLMDENTIYCNTDSLVSLKPRDEFKIGKQLGEWKIEHQGKFAFKGFNYQWNDEVPSYRGIPKSWFKDGWDILKDDLPVNQNIYVFDKSKCEILEKEFQYDIKSIKK